MTQQFSIVLRDVQKYRQYNEYLMIVISLYQNDIELIII